MIDMNTARECDAANYFVDAFSKCLKLGSVACEPDKITFFCSIIEREESIVITTDAGA